MQRRVGHGRAGPQPLETLEQVADDYRAMDERRATKTLLTL